MSTPARFFPCGDLLVPSPFAESLWPPPSLWGTSSPLPPCGGGLGWGVTWGNGSQSLPVVPPTLTLPRKGGGDKIVLPRTREGTRDPSPVRGEGVKTNPLRPTAPGATA